MFLWVQQIKQKRLLQRKRENKEKGNIAKSKELPVAMTLLAFTLLVPTLFSYVVDTLKSSLNYF